MRDTRMNREPFRRRERLRKMKPLLLRVIAVIAALLFAGCTSHPERDTVSADHTPRDADSLIGPNGAVV